MKGGFNVAKKMNFSLKSPAQSLDADDAEEDGFSEKAGDNPNALVTFSFTNDSSKVTNNSLPLDSSVLPDGSLLLDSSGPLNSIDTLNSSKPFESSLPLSIGLQPNSSIAKIPVVEPQSPAIAKVPVESKKAFPSELVDTRKLQLQSNGITPPIDGEYFEIKRTFIFRRSTVRMLNKLKAEHPDVNVYLSTIVDEALRHYYEAVLNKVER